MLINLSNHPSKNWCDKQLSEAGKLFGVVMDIPFPKINPVWDEDKIKKLADEYFDVCVKKFASFSNENNAVHLMGEFTFAFALVKKLLEHNIICVASTTERIATETNGKKISEFKFVRFRDYK